MKTFIVEVTDIIYGSFQNIKANTWEEAKEIGEQKLCDGDTSWKPPVPEGSIETGEVYEV